MTDHPNQKIPADSDAIARCREALETDDMLSVAQRRDWACLMESYDAACSDHEVTKRELEASKAVCAAMAKDYDTQCARYRDAVEQRDAARAEAEERGRCVVPDQPIQKIRPDRLREIAEGAMGIGAPLVLTQAEQVAVCTEVLALREQNARLVAGMMALGQERLDAEAERDAAGFRAEKLAAELLSCREACDRKHHDGWAWQQLAQQREAERDAERERFNLLSQRCEAAERMRDAYREAKQENDERFMQERDAGRAEAEKLRAELAAIRGRDAKPFDWDGVPTVEEWIAENLREREPRAGSAMVELHPDEVVADRGESRRVAGWLKDLLAELEAARDEVTQLEGMERQRDACCDDYQKEAARAVALEAELAAVRRQRDEFAEHIATRTYNNVRDGACQQCFPWEEVSGGFVCVPHKAVAIHAEQPAPAPAQQQAPIEPRPWWVVFGLERHAASRMVASAPNSGPLLVDMSLRHLADDANKRGVHPTEIARALDEARAELQPKPEAQP